MERDLDLSDLEAGKIYVIHYKLNGQRFHRYAQLEFLGRDGSRKLLFRGRPGINEVMFMREEIRRIDDINPDKAKVTYYDKRNPL